MPKLGCHGPAISADGQYIAFYSPSPDIVLGDTNASSTPDSGMDVFVRTRQPDYVGVSGTVSFDGLAPFAAAPQHVSVRVTLAGVFIGEVATALSESGSFLISLPRGNLTLSLKQTHWLRSTIAVDTTQGGASGVQIAEQNGDANGDNHIGLLDIAMVLANWATPDDMADLNNDGVTSLDDLAIALMNFGIFGDP
jgi:hypothetical protein